MFTEIEVLFWPTFAVVAVPRWAMAASALPGNARGTRHEAARRSMLVPRTNRGQRIEFWEFMVERG
jgi:hypothetical protein